jgi:uncharacterized protein (TIGR03435 family)
MNTSLWHTPWIAILVNHLWQSTVFVLAIWLLTLALRKNRASVRHGLWMLASLKFLIPFSLLIAAGERLHRHASVAAAPGLAAAMNGFAQPFSMDVATKSAPGVSGASVANLAPGTTGHAGLLPVLLLVLWAGGAVYLLTRWTLRWWRIRAAVRAALPLDLGLALPVLSAPIDLEPGVFGIVRPLLLLPSSVGERLSPAQLDAIIAHELCHVRRHDNLTAALHMLVEAIFWFHPAVWWIGAKLWEERERACDEAVLESRPEALVYAEGILNVCKTYVEAPLSCVAGVTGGELKQRIGRIVSRQTGSQLGLWRKLLLALAAVLVVAAPVTTGLVRAAQAQAQPAPQTGIEGTWQGTLHTEQRDQRAVWKISRKESGGLKIMMYNADQGGPGVPASSASFEGGVLKSTTAAYNVRFEGKLSADRQSIVGTWTQGDVASGQLVMERATPATAWAVPEPPAPISRMAAGADPSFEVATIKPSKPDQALGSYGWQGTRLKIVNQPMQGLIDTAYGVQRQQIVNAPSWLMSERYDVDAQPDIPGMPSLEQQSAMIRKLLADRLRLKVHREQRELAAYVLTVAPDGPKIKRSADDSQEGTSMRVGGGHNLLLGSKTEMATLAENLQSQLDRPVVDETGLQGQWDFELKWAPEDASLSGEGGDEPPLLVALQQQLGLKLVPNKAMVEVLVIDHVEKPSEN